jgi:LacI family transcriptional regulator, gluconate utilization system Gnt-I transcriptional repressor
MSETENVKKSRRSSGAITLRDVAKLAGVAPITASRAINTPNLVSEHVLKSVQDAVDKTGYVPNRMAGGLASSRTRLIAAVVPSTVISVFMETIESLNASLFDAGYQLMLGQSSYSVQREEALLEAIIGRRPDGIFITGILPPGRGRSRLLSSGIPVVESWDLTPTPIDMLIGFSHADIGRDAAKYLMSKGYSRFALVSAEDERAIRRTVAFSEEVHSKGYEKAFEVNVGAKRSLKRGREALIEILEKAPLVDAVFCSSDLLALGVLTELRARKISTPKDIAVMGFGDVPFVSDMVPSLTTVRINGEQIGSMAAQFLIDRAEHRTVANPIVNVGYSIIERESA